MDSSQAHVATLAALGTIGVAATGLALGTGGETFLTRPGKRKSPGADTLSFPSNAYFPPPTSTPPQPSRRAVSQPTAPSSTASSLQRTLSTSLFRRKHEREPKQTSTPRSITLTQSEGSAMNRTGNTASSRTRDASMGQDDLRPRSSWLKRLSTMSSVDSHSPAPSISNAESGNTPSRFPPEREPPNKLVKRVTSQRMLTTDQVRSSGSFLRRPVTSHQRSASMLSMSTPQPIAIISEKNDMSPMYVSSSTLWHPFFNSSYPRKRHTSAGVREGNIRTVTASYAPRPTLVTGRAIQRRPDEDDLDERPPSSSPLAPASSLPRQRLKRSMGSLRRKGRRRNFTDPVCNSSHFSPVPQNPVEQSQLSPVSRSSTFDIELPHGTPVFTSSPPLVHVPRGNPTISKRISIARSDPNTVSSDNDPRVFTDDDSMDFQSDTAYDSLATRATASSHSGFKQPKIETIFDEPMVEQGSSQIPTLEALMHRSTLEERAVTSVSETPAWVEKVGIGIEGVEAQSDRIHDAEEPQVATPIRNSSYSYVEELNATPLAFHRVGKPVYIDSSRPSSIIRRPISTTRQTIPETIEAMDIDLDSIDWSPKSEKDANGAPVPPSSPTRQGNDSLLRPEPDMVSSKRSSIFDWSEGKKTTTDSSNGVSPRPKTVHGKQSNDPSRSRPSGRKGPNAMHLRSQSVPVSRDSTTEVDGPPSTAKFGTWGLGHKPVSEEWSEDFEFDDMEEIDGAQPTTNPRFSKPESIRSVKVPQAIIDRQASVQLQFGQVQEFMLLVEGLKRLRAQGAMLDLLDSNAKQLWDDAENIISLATLNDEDEGPLRPSSPTASDIFGDETSPNSQRTSVEEAKRISVTQRSVSTSATTPPSRPRGESLAQAKSFLHTIHQNRNNGGDLSPRDPSTLQREKLPFDTQDLRDLVTRAGVITRALKEIVRKAEGVSVSPECTPQRKQNPTFSQIFNPPEASPCPAVRKPGLPKSRSANSYLGSAVGNSENEMPTPLKFTMIEAN